jgi:hypothetical protein
VKGFDIKPRSILTNDEVDGKEEISKKPRVNPSVLGGMVVNCPTPTNSNNNHVNRQKAGKKEVFHPPMTPHHLNVNRCGNGGKFYFGESISPDVVLSNGGWWEDKRWEWQCQWM